MSFKNVDIESAMRRLAERRIEDAMQEGKFDNLQGAGKPLDLEPLPPDENSRLKWWALRLLRQNDVTPDEVRLRKAIDHLKERLAAATSESHLVRIVEQVNELVHKVNTLGTNALSAPVASLNLEAERARWLDARKT